MLVEVKPRTRKPAFGSVEVNRAHPLARQLKAAFIFNEQGGAPFEVIRNIRPAAAGSGDTWTVGAAGVGMKFDGSSVANCRMLYGTSYGSAWSSAQAVSVFSQGQLFSVPTNAGIINLTGAGDATNTA